MELILTDWHWAYLPIIFFAYIIFGLSGFGTALIAAPWLSLYLPLNHIIPMIVILDAIASFKNWYQSQQHVQYLQVKRLFPFMLVGATIGICLLTYGQPKFLLLCMAIFCIAYSVYQLLKKTAPIQSNSPYLATVTGFFGGLFGALFGSGGFLYALFLQRNLDQKIQIQSTQSVLISLSTSVRLILCLILGLYSFSLLLLVILLTPSMLLGTYIGRKMMNKMSLTHFNQLIYILVLCFGISLLFRFAASAG